jgi:hypothetical protein
VVVGVWNDLKGIQSQQLKVLMLLLGKAILVVSPPSLLVHDLGLFGLSILSLL